MKEGSCFLMTDIEHFVARSPIPVRTSIAPKSKGSGAAQNAAILDPAKFVKGIGFVIHATLSVS